MILIGLVFTTSLFAQEPPSDWGELVANINVWLATLGGVAAVTVFLAAFVNRIFNAEGFVKQVVAWLVAIAVVTIGNVANMGFMAEFGVLSTIIYGIAAGFVANGIFDIATIQTLLKLINLEKK